MKTLMIDVKKDGFVWAIKQDNEILKKGRSDRLEDVRQVEKSENVTTVVIDEAFRTFEVRAACLLFGWRPVKRRSGIDIKQYRERIEKGISEYQED